MPSNKNDLLRFWTPAQVKLYSKTHRNGTVWIDDAVGIDIAIQDQKTPIYGFRDRYFRTYSQGQTLVSGNLYINFRYPGYLTKLIKNLGYREDPKESDVLDPPKAFKPTETEPIDTNVFEDALITGNIKQYLEYAKEFKNVYYKNSLPDSKTKRPSEEQTQDTAPFNIHIVYGDRELDPVDIPTYLVEDVVLIGQSQTITALDGRGDQILLEMYQFFARNLVIR